jgi:uncharacterized protein DUF4105
VSIRVYSWLENRPLAVAQRIAAIVGLLLAWLTLLLLHTWATLAIYFANYHHPFARTPIPIAYALFLILLVVLVRRHLLRLLAVLVVFILVAVWWMCIQPTGRGDYMPPVAVQAYPEFRGNFVTIHNLRNFDYRTRNNYDVRYEDRTYDLNRLTHVDFLINYWDGKRDTAHTALSFGFDDGNYVAVSVEIRGQKGDTYEFLRGLFKQFELFYVIGDERDVIRVRTNYQNEEVHLYRTNCTPENARKLFVDFLKGADALRTHPRFYDTLFCNCTTTLIEHINRVLPTKVPFWQRRMMNGYTDYAAYEHGWLAGSESFPVLRAKSNINGRALKADRDPDFSAKIRTHFELGKEAQ